MNDVPQDEHTALAPALQRGLKLLVFLNDHPQGMLLETLARHWQWPKSSTLRLLHTLAEQGVALRTHDGRWRACMRLAPLRESAPDPQLLHQTLEQYANNLGHTLEWWQPERAGMVLQQRHQPLRLEVSARAKVGFVRPWDQEMDAVALLGHAYHLNSQHLPDSACYYAQAACMAPLDRPTGVALLKQIRKQGWALDHASNSNGIQRLAMPMRHESTLCGVVAMAMVHVPGKSLDPNSFHQALTQLVLSLA